jgi:hypothetical protein
VSLEITREDRLAFAKLGDVDLDGIIAPADFKAIANRYGAVIGTPKYDSFCDLNADGKIDLEDVHTCAKNVGLSIEEWKRAMLGLPQIIIPQVPAPTPEVPAPPPTIIPAEIIPVSAMPISPPPEVKVPPAPTVPVELLIIGAIGVVLLIGGIAYLIYVGGSTSG